MDAESVQRADGLNDTGKQKGSIGPRYDDSMPGSPVDPSSIPSNGFKRPCVLRSSGFVFNFVLPRLHFVFPMHDSPLNHVLGARTDDPRSQQFCGCNPDIDEGGD